MPEQGPKRGLGAKLRWPAGREERLRESLRLAKLVEAGKTKVPPPDDEEEKKDG